MTQREGRHGEKRGRESEQRERGKHGERGGTERVSGDRRRVRTSRVIETE